LLAILGISGTNAKGARAEKTRAREECRARPLPFFRAGGEGKMKFFIKKFEQIIKKRIINVSK
jgi:hypothetical protein